MVLRTTRFASLLALAGTAFLLTACGDDAASETSGPTSGSSGATGGGGAGSSTGSAGEGSGGGGGNVASDEFTVRIENVSGNASIVTPISPGVFALHADADPIFSEGQPDRGQGLEHIAED